MTIRRIPFRILVILALALLKAPQTATSTQQQSASQGGTAKDTNVPRVVTLSGVARNHDGQALTGIVGLTFAMYRDQQGGSSLWIETQNVAVDDQGRYTVLLGGSAPEGLPRELFVSGEPRWLGVTVQMPGEPEQPRLQLGSVPYALKALDADTLGGLPLSSFVRTPDSEKTTLNTVFASKTGSKPVVSALTGSVTNYIPVFTDDTGTQDKSVMYQNGAKVGINTTTPAFPLGVQGGIEAFSDAFPQINFRQTGAASGFAAQEYRYQIDPDGSYRIYDMTHGVTPRFVLTPGGAVGIGTANPGFMLDVAGGIGAGQIVASSNEFPQIDFLQTGAADGFPAQEYRYQINPDGSYRIYDITHGVTPRFTLTNSGSIGIGTSSPTAKLEVTGTVKATALVGDGSGLTNLPVAPATDVNCATPCISTGEIVNGAVTSALIAPGTIVDGNINPLAAIAPSKIAGTAATLGANTFTNSQTLATGNLILPGTSSALSGVITMGGSRFLHGYTPSGALEHNTFLGNNAGNFATTGGGFNTGLGASSLGALTTGIGNTASGGQALSSNTSGNQNTASGSVALWSNTTGGTNTADGAATLFSNTTGSSNSATALGALAANTTGNGNTALGYSAGLDADALVNLGGGPNANKTGSFNTFVGYRSGAGTPTQLTNATAIGANALVSADNSLVLGGSTVNVGIGTSAPSYKLDVQGGQINASGGLCINGNCQTSWPSGSGTITGVTAGTGLSGGGTTGTVTLNVAGGGIGTVQLADSGVTSPKIAAGTIVDANINASAAIAPSKIAGTAATLGANTFTGNQAVNGTMSATAFVGNGSALTNLPYRTRAITYLGGCDTCSPLADTDSQRTIYFNTVGPMTVMSVTCFSDAGTPTINLKRDDGSPANILTSDLSCSPSGTTTTSFSLSESVINLNDKLDFVMVSAGGTAKRVTVSITAILN